MRFKFLLILFLGLFISFGGEIKAQENICKYSNYKDYKKCKKKGLLSVPEYPIENFHWTTVAMGPCISCVDQAAVGNAHQITELKAFSRNHVQVFKGYKTVGLFGLTWRRPFTNKETIKINPNNIISMKKRDYFSQTLFGRPLYREYKIKYIDDYGEVESLEFEQFLEGKSGTFDIVGDYLIYASNLNWDEEKSVKSLREKILKENEKNIEIIKSIILTKNNTLKNCIEVKDTKFPELVQKYENISRTINPLRMKLDLPPSSDLKLICK